MCTTHHDCSKSKCLPVILQHLDEVLLGWLWDEGEAGLQGVLQRTKPVIGRDVLERVRGGRNISVCVCVHASVLVAIPPGGMVGTQQSHTHHIRAGAGSGLLTRVHTHDGQ